MVKRFYTHFSTFQQSNCTPYEEYKLEQRCSQIRIYLMKHSKSVIGLTETTGGMLLLSEYSFIRRCTKFMHLYYQILNNNRDKEKIWTGHYCTTYGVRFEYFCFTFCRLLDCSSQHTTKCRTMISWQLNEGLHVLNSWKLEWWYC